MGFDTFKPTRFSGNVGRIVAGVLEASQINLNDERIGLNHLLNQSTKRPMESRALLSTWGTR